MTTLFDLLTDFSKMNSCDVVYAIPDADGKFSAKSIAFLDHELNEDHEAYNLVKELGDYGELLLEVGCDIRYDLMDWDRDDYADVLNEEVLSENEKQMAVESALWMVNKCFNANAFYRHETNVRQELALGE